MLDQAYTVLDHVMGLSSSSHELGFGQMAARAALMYLLLIAVMRAGKKRALGRATVFDTILVIIIGSIAARALTGGAPYFPSVLALVVLVLMHWIMSALARRSSVLAGWVKGHSTVIIRQGTVDAESLRAEHMSGDDLNEDLRTAGVDDPGGVREARLERSGKLSVLTKTK